MKRFIRKFMKKSFSIILALSMIIGMNAIPAVNVNAGTGDITYHFKLPAGWTAATTFYHSWSGSALTGGPTIEAWDAQKTTLVDEGDGWAKITITNGVNETGFSLVNWDAVDASADNELKLFNSGVKYANITDAFCNITDTTGDGLAAWYKEKAMTNEITPLVPQNVYYVTGSEAIAGYNWGDGFADGHYGLPLEETSQAGVYSAIVRKVPAGSYEFKITQDPEHFAWNLAIGSEAGGNFGFTTTELKDVTIRLNLNEAGDDRIEILLAKPQVLASEVIEAINAIGTVTLDSEVKIKAAEDLYAAAPTTEQVKVTNYATLTAARKAYDALKEAEATSGYDVVVHFQNSVNWDKVNAYAFYGDAKSELLGGWPGTTIQADTKNTGWFTTGFNMSDKSIGSFNIIFTDSTNQTNDIPAELSAGKGEFWITLTGATEPGSFGKEVLSAAITMSTPEGWVPSEVPKNDPDNTDPGNTDPGNTDSGNTDSGNKAPDNTTPETIIGQVSADENKNNTPTQTTVSTEVKENTTPVKTGDTAPVAMALIFVTSASIVVFAKKKVS